MTSASGSASARLRDREQRAGYERVTLLTRRRQTEDAKDKLEKDGKKVPKVIRSAFLALW